ncbi:uncharacterized protein c-cup [Drosophila takahashii]|uniref:uncharacterized protein c-cup n=1 Tax=Drosophila takahashii TaxID=29030 RepID=UPI001CF91F44|nr:membrane steroid-binding protein 2 [Drosophila takahashii]
MLGQMYAARLSPNLETATRLLKSPLGQALISFLLGYLATTKLSQMYSKLKCDSDKSDVLGIEDEDEDSEPQDESELLPQGNGVVILSTEELTAFDGLNPDLPMYTALNGLIYDLSPGREKFLSHGPYSFMAGCNANKLLKIACASMGVCAANVINRWERSLKAEFNIVGYLIDADVEMGAGDLENVAEDLESEHQTETSEGV